MPETSYAAAAWPLHVTGARVHGSFGTCSASVHKPEPPMDWWDEVRLSLQTFLDNHGVLAGFVMILVEEAGVPVPVPGDFLMLALGAHARQGRVPLWEAILVLEAA